jgi:hypothetical protein
VADTFNSTINDRAYAPVNAPVAPYSPQTQAESYKAYMGSVALTAPDSMGFLSGSTLYGGIVNGFADIGTVNAVVGRPLTVSSYYVGATVATPVTGLRAGVAFDYLNLCNANNDDYSFAGYLSYQATEKLSFHARAEYLKDSTPVLFGPTFDTTTGELTSNPAKILALTATVQYDLWKNVISRLEVRWDHSLTDTQTFGGTTYGVPTMDNAWMIAANVIYKF